MTNRKKDQSVDLYLLGLGINKLNQITIETRDALAKARVIFHIGETESELRKINRNTVDISDLYWQNNNREKVYKQLKEHIISEIAAGPRVAFVTYGHPLFFDQVNLSLLRFCKRKKLNCLILPAVSCLDTLSIDLEIDYADGTQILEATSMVREESLLCTSMHLMVLQIGEYDWDATSDGLIKKAGHYKSLIRYMKKYYPANHNVQIVYSSDGHGTAVKRKIPIAKLDEFRDIIFPGTTMYIPPIKQSGRGL